MVNPPNRKCWSAHREMHIGTCFDAWTDPNQVCVCNPADQAEYPNTNRMYVGATITGVGNANIKTYFNGAFGKTHPGSGDYMHVWWESGGWWGVVRFDLCSGDTVIASRSTKWVAPPPPELPELTENEAQCSIFDLRTPAEGSAPFTVKYRIHIDIDSPHAFVYKPGITINDVYIPLRDTFSQTVTFNDPPTEGDATEMSSGKGGKLRFVSVIFDDVGTYDAVAKYGFGCDPIQVVVNPPKPDPCEGVSCEPECVGVDLYDTVCDEGICVRGVLLEDDSLQCGYEPPACDIPRADINRDSIVDIDDQILLGAAYDSRPGDANWNPDADINQDSIVNYKDLGILSANYGCEFEHVPMPEPAPPLQPIIPGMPEPEEPAPEPEPAWEETYTINNLLDMSKTYESHGMTFEIPAVACLHQDCWISRIDINGVDRGKIEVGKSIVVDDVTFYLKSISPPSGLPFVVVLSGGKPEPEPEEPEPEPEPTNDTMMYIYVSIGVILVFMMLRGS